MKNTQLTKEGFQKLETELEELKTKKRPAAVGRLTRARSMGDLSENSEYTASKEELNFIDHRVAELEEILHCAKIADKGKDIDMVELGETVVVQSNGETLSYQIVGEYEADPLNNKISSTSPIGQALLGKKINDEVEIEAPAGKTKYKIIAIK